MLINWNIKLYKFFDRHKWALYTILGVTTVLFAWLGSKVVYEEDLTKFLPASKSGSSQELVFETLRVKDKIFLQFVPKNDTVAQEDLIAACDMLTNSLLHADSLTGDIASVLYCVKDEWIMDGMAYLFAHAPLFIDDTHYAGIDTLTAIPAMERQMDENLSLIASASSMAYYDMVRQDPIALRKLFLGQDNGAMTSGFGGNFTLIDRHFFTPDSAVLLAFVSPDFTSFNSKAGSRLITLLEKEIATFNRTNSQVEVLFHGAPVRSAFNSRQIKKDLAVTLGLSLLVVCLALGLCFKNRSSIPLLIVPVIYGALMALSAVYLIQGGMSLMALGIGAVILGVALSYCLHVITHYKYLGDPIAVIQDQTLPLLLGCVTNIGAFLGLMFTQSSLLRDFGLFASFAIFGTTLFCLVFLPHFFSPSRNRRSQRVFHRLEWLNAYPIDQKKWLIILIVIVCAGSLYTKRFVSFDSDLTHIGYIEANVLRSEKLYAEKVNGGKTAIYYAASSKDLDSALIYSHHLTAVLDSLQQEGQIESFTRATGLLSAKAEQLQRINQWHDYWNAERVARVEASLTAAGRAKGFKPEMFAPFFASLTADYQPSSLYAAGVIPEELMSNIIEYTADSAYLIFTSTLIDPEHRKHVSDIVTAKPHLMVIDPFYYTSDMVTVLNEDFDTALNISSIFVFLVLLLAYRSFSRAVLAFIPMGLSWFVVLGFMGLFGLQFNLINIIISTFIFGIGVDYSIYVMDGLLGNTRRGYAKLLMYHKTAIIFSAFVLMVSISSLMFASHPAIKSIGLTTLVGMASTVLITYTLQPFLFKWLAKSALFKKFGRKNK
ncbi:MAG: MMPL family transporter [Prevotellaceae bacterium]|jgi:predicted RND superfamily exporter protein|nr:MMPL family transporter [Prevotellaceae bacterium]